MKTLRCEHLSTVLHFRVFLYKNHLLHVVDVICHHNEMEFLVMYYQATYGLILGTEYSRFKLLI